MEFGQMTPYEILVEAVKENPRKSFRDAWRDFAIWERSRGYADDPSASSKDALAWVRELDDLVVRLDEFDGAAKEHCRNALEGAFVAFARLDHKSELCDAIRRWRQWRLAEKAECQSTDPFVPDGATSHS
jgi:hypothetical protein